jgi:hypothetical protein
MNDAQSTANVSPDERRAYPRYELSATRLSLTIEDTSLGETIRIGEAIDISLGGLRMTHLPPHSNVQLGDKLGLLLIGDETALPLRGEVVHHGAGDSFGIKFQTLSLAEQRRVDRLLQRLQH